MEHPVDFKSTLQERLAQRGELVDYAVVQEQGPAHDRIFTVNATVDGKLVGSGSGRSKKAAEQRAARSALGDLDAQESTGAETG
jgi:ribonuclease-3